MKKNSITLLILTFLVFSTTTLFAKGECKEDAKKFCENVKKGEGRVFQCLVNHFEELTPNCKKKIENAKDKWQNLKNNCGSDLEKFCPNVQPGKGKIRACLAKNKDQLSESCKTYLKEKKDKKKKDEFESVSEIEQEIHKQD